MERRSGGLSEDELDSLARRIAENIKNETCALGIDPEAFADERDFVRSLMRIAERLDGIKWGFLGSLIKGAGFTLLGILGLGILVWAKTRLGLR